jgi:hypothetical protein
MQSPQNPMSVALLAAATALLASLPASAQEQCGDTVCDLGWSCWSYEPACPACDSADCGECVPTVIYTCGFARCESDADCASYMRCTDLSTMDCPVEVSGACLEGETDDECGARIRSEEAAYCTQVDYRACRFRWSLPCTSAEDCGEGFECVEAGACNLIENSCSTDTDCPEAWHCEAVRDQTLPSVTEQCMPPVLVGVGGSLTMGSVEPTAEASESAQAGSSDPSETPAQPGIRAGEGGCATRGAPAPAGHGALALLLGLVAAARRGRRGS